MWDNWLHRDFFPIFAAIKEQYVVSEHVSLIGFQVFRHYFFCGLVIVWIQ